MKPTDKEYIDAVAIKYAAERGGDLIHEALHTIDARNGYQLALDHTNHAELLEAAKSFIKDATIELLQALRESITKSETSKLK